MTNLIKIPLRHAKVALIAVPLASCGPIDACKHAELRRQTYTAAITAADAWEASGRPVPYQLALGRQAAVVALASLNGRCPKP